MKATFALLADRIIHNIIRKIAWKADRNYGIGTDAARLEPHVSLKQPFEVCDIIALEAYMAEFAASISPFEIHLTKIRAIPTRIDDVETGILWFDVEETSYLRGLHHRLNEELETQFGPTPAKHDGDRYHFHMTIAIGNKPFNVYQRIVDSFLPGPVDLTFMATELALFVYNENAWLGGGYMTYKILPLGQDQPTTPGGVLKY
jgi:2'-5' RNA ligase